MTEEADELLKYFLESMHDPELDQKVFMSILEVEEISFKFWPYGVNSRVDESDKMLDLSYVDIIAFDYKKSRFKFYFDSETKRLFRGKHEIWLEDKYNE